eukprot:5972461-Pyramimonas_sp.AAC.1
MVHIKPRSRLSASQWQSVGREYTSNILWSIRNAVRCEWCTSVVDSRRLSTVELKSKAFLAIDSLRFTGLAFHRLERPFSDFDWPACAYVAYDTGARHHYYNTETPSNKVRDDSEFTKVQRLARHGIVEFGDTCVEECHTSREECEECFG